MFTPNPACCVGTIRRHFWTSFPRGRDSSACRQTHDQVHSFAFRPILKLSDDGAPVTWNTQKQEEFHCDRGSISNKRTAKDRRMGDLTGNWVNATFYRRKNYQKVQICSNRFTRPSPLSQGNAGGGVCLPETEKCASILTVKFRDQQLLMSRKRKAKIKEGTPNFVLNHENIAQLKILFRCTNGCFSVFLTFLLASQHQAQTTQIQNYRWNQNRK